MMSSVRCRLHSYILLVCGALSAIDSPLPIVMATLNFSGFPKGLLLVLIAIALFNLRPSRYHPSGAADHLDVSIIRNNTAPLKHANITSQVKPTFLIHIGPPKSATTFLQCSLCAPRVDTILEKDNIVYLGTCHMTECGMSSFPDQYMNHDGDAVFPRIPRPGVLQPDFVERVLKLVGKNVIFVFEEMPQSDARIQQLVNLLKPHWHVQIVMGYRPFAEWFLSFYNQLSKPNVVHPRDRWPPLDSALAPFDPSSKQARALLASKKGIFFESYLAAYSRQFEHISIIPLHRLSSKSAPKDVDVTLHELLCRVLQTAPHTCQAVKDGRLRGAEASNPSVPLEYDMLATAAYKNSMISPALSRSTVRDAIGVQAVSRPLTRDVCLSNATLDKFERLSWNMEQRIFPMHPEWESSHRAVFNYLRDDRKAFCTIDAEAILQDPKWVEFFQELKD